MSGPSKAERDGSARVVACNLCGAQVGSRCTRGRGDMRERWEPHVIRARSGERIAAMERAK